MTFNLDGEPLSGKTFRMELLPAALRCRLPPTARCYAEADRSTRPATLRWRAYESQTVARITPRQPVVNVGRVRRQPPPGINTGTATAAALLTGLRQ
jgi:hypothetical protein